MTYVSRYAWKVAAVLMVALSPAPWAAAQFGEGGQGDDSKVIALDVWLMTLAATEDAPVKLAEWQKPMQSRADVSKLIDKAISEPGVVQRFKHFSLITTEHQPLSVQIGRRQPRVTAVSRGDRGVTGRNFVFENTGTLLTGDVVALSDKRVAVNLVVEQSHLEPSDVVLEEQEKKESTNATQTITFSSNISVTCPDGKVLCALASTKMSREGDPRHLILLVSASVIEDDQASESNTESMPEIKTSRSVGGRPASNRSIPPTVE